MTATLPVPNDRPVQLTLDLWTPSPTRRSHVRPPFWERVDLADLGGELHASRAGVRAVLTATKRDDGSWVGYHDLLLASGGSSGPTRPQSSRFDALVSAAYGLVQYCRRLLASAAPKSDMQAARQLIRWVELLDLT